MSQTTNASRHILLVDDDPLVIKVYAERMRFEGWNVAIARDGWEACQEATRSKFDMILLDIRMPFQDGRAVLQEIRKGELNRETPVHLLTSMPEGDELDSAVQLGADGVFHKSATRPDELVSAVDKLLRPMAQSIEEEALDLVGAGTELLRQHARGQGAAAGGGAPMAGEDAASSESYAPVGEEYEVFVNPFLGDAAKIAELVGLDASYRCPSCGGQVSLKLASNPLGRVNDLTGYFFCNMCDAQI
jgi:CheY-like chemotaxis protein